MSRSLSRDKKDDKKDVSKSTPAPQPNIVKVPSRSRKIDPRMKQMLERGLEYVSKIEDPEKRNARSKKRAKDPKAGKIEKNGIF